MPEGETLKWKSELSHCTCFLHAKVKCAVSFLLISFLSLSTYHWGFKVCNWVMRHHHYWSKIWTVQICSQQDIIGLEDICFENLLHQLQDQVEPMFGTSYSHSCPRSNNHVWMASEVPAKDVIPRVVLAFPHATFQSNYAKSLPLSLIIPMRRAIYLLCL